MQKAWDFTWDNFFCDKMNLFYDYLVNDFNNKLTGHLPSVDDINNQIPNPCGWGTGMEDSTLSAGSMLDAVVARYNATGDVSMKLLADKIFDGMMRCVVDLEDGFIARSVSPIDGNSFYFDTSRDQFTHWVYGGLRLYNSEIADSEQKENIKRVIVAVAKRLERNVTLENNYNLLRYDNKESIAGKMWGDLGKHEYFRLPFFYISAWYVSGDKHWFDLYMKYRDEAFEKMCEDFDAKNYGLRCYPVLQMQYSLRAAYDIDPDFGFKEKCKSFMTKVADYYKNFTVSESQRICTEIDSDYYSYQYKAWNAVDMRFDGVFGDREYRNPAQSERHENRGFYLIRNVGEAVSILALCPDFEIKEEQFHALQNLCDAIDYDRIFNYSPMLLVCGWWLAKESMRISEKVS